MSDILAPLAVLDLSVLRTFTDGEIEVEREFAELFVSESEEQILALSGQCTEGENIAWAETAHKLKGVAATLGAEALRELCSRAQKMRIATRAERDEMLLTIREYYAAVLQELKNLRLLD